jgi:hypothetical protein
MSQFVLTICLPIIKLIGQLISHWQLISSRSGAALRWILTFSSEPQPVSARRGWQQNQFMDGSIPQLEPGVLIVTQERNTRSVLNEPCNAH